MPLSLFEVKKMIQEIAQKVVRNCLQIKEDERVVIDAHMIEEDELDFISEIGFECEAIGASPVIVAKPKKYFIKTMKEVDIKYLGKSPEHLLALYKEADARIGVIVRTETDEMNQISSDRWQALSKFEERLTDLFVNKQLKTMNIYFPSKGLASELDIPYERLLNMFLSAMNIDYDKLHLRSEKIADILRNGDVVRILSETGTDLTFNIKGRRVSIDDGTLSDERLKQGIHYGELPTGEVFTAPIEDSAEGTAVFETPTETRTLRNIKLTFKKGQVVKAEAEEGIEIFNRRLELATGDKDKIAEFAIGTNPNMTVDYPLSNEKSLGTIHIAIGRNDHIGGKNKSSLHWDLIMHKPTVYIDNEKILENGKLLVE